MEEAPICLTFSDFTTSDLLLSNSFAGSVRILNVKAARRRSSFKTRQWPSSQGVCVSGIVTSSDHLFFTSLDQHLFTSVPIPLSARQASRSIVTPVNITGSADGFALSRDGRTESISLNGGNATLEVNITSRISRYINSPLLESTSSVALSGSRSQFGSELLYISGAVMVDNATTIGGLFEAQLCFGVGCAVQGI
jgi:hypothetical protein